MKKADKNLKAIEEGVASGGITTTTISAAVDDRFKEIEKKVNWIRDVMYYMIAVLLVGFILALIAYFQFVADLNRDYKNAVEQFNNQKFQFMQTQVDRLSTPSSR